MGHPVTTEGAPSGPVQSRLCSCCQRMRSMIASYVGSLVSSFGKAPLHLDLDNNTSLGRCQYSRRMCEEKAALGWTLCQQLLPNLLGYCLDQGSEATLRC